MTHSLLVIALLTSAISTISANAAEVVRAAIDIGSASTKLRVARVDPDRQVTVKVLLDKKSVALPFEESRKASGEKNELPEAMLPEAVKILKELKADAIGLAGSAEVHFSAVATSAFRKATNAASFAENLSRQTGIPIKIVQQREEAMLGFFAGAAAYPNLTPDSIVVWDIGGGSTQLVWRENGVFQVLGGDFASVGMKRHVLDEIKQSAHLKSPNPLGSSAALLATEKAKAEWHQIVKTNAAESAIRGRTVIGIGPVHAVSIQKQTRPGENSYSASEVKHALNSSAVLDDVGVAYRNNPTLRNEIEQITDNEQRAARLAKETAYTDTDVTNLALALGFLEILDIDTVKTADSNLNEGLLVAPEYWR